jgi:hypothetical protein
MLRRPIRVFPRLVQVVLEADALLIVRRPDIDCITAPQDLIGREKIVQQLCAGILGFILLQGIIAQQNIHTLSVPVRNDQ